MYAQALALGEIPKRDHAGLGLGWLERALEAGGRSWRASQAGAMSDAAESFLLVALCGGLWLVLWRRRNLRNMQQQQQQPQPQHRAQQVQSHLPVDI